MVKLYLFLCLVNHGHNWMDLFLILVNCGQIAQLVHLLNVAFLVFSKSWPRTNSFPRFTELWLNCTNLFTCYSNHGQVALISYSFVLVNHGLVLMCFLHLVIHCHVKQTHSLILVNLGHILIHSLDLLRGHELPLFFILYCSLRCTYNVIKIFTLKKNHNLEVICYFLICF